MMMVDLLVSPFHSIVFYCIYLKVFYFVHRGLVVLHISRKLTFLKYVEALSTSTIIYPLIDYLLSDITVTIPEFFWLIHA